MELAENFVQTLVAPRRKGKSYLIKAQLRAYLLDDFDNIKIFCVSSQFNNDYDEFREESNVEIFSNFTQQDIEDVFHQHEKCAALVKQMHDEKYECPHTLIILDDVIDSGVLNFRGIVDKIAERGRHINLSLIVSSQRLRAVSCSIRMNTDYFIIFATSQVAELEKFLEEFVFRRQRKDLIEILNQLFDIPRVFLIVDASAESNENRLQYSDARNYIQGITKPILLNQTDPNSVIP